MATIREIYAFPKREGLERSLDLVSDGQASRFRLNEVRDVVRTGKKGDNKAFRVHNQFNISFGEMGQLVGFIDEFMPHLEEYLGH